MENAVEALKTAAAVLIFVIAITVSFTMFSKAKATADAIITSKDKQEYLEAAELDNGILYTSSEAISKAGDTETQSAISGMTTKGDRIVEKDDVISTIYRYYLEKYGVTIMKSNGEVIARFDSATESFVQSWTKDMKGKDNNDNELTADELLNKYEEQIKRNISNTYVLNGIEVNLKTLYNVTLKDSDTSSTKEIGAPWYGTESEIIKRVNADLEGINYIKNGQTYQGKGLKKELKNKKIIEVVNEIDTSEYIKDGENKTSLLKEYQLPTIEVVYIIEG